MAKKKTRHMWTDEERERLIIGAEHTPGTLKDYLKSQGINSNGWFSKMRREYIAAHPDFDVTVLQAGEAIEPPKPKRGHPPKPLAFIDADESQKRKLIQEYQSLPRERFYYGKEPGPSQKKLWLTAHGLSEGRIVRYYAKTLGASSNHKQPRPVKTLAVAAAEALPLTKPAHVASLDDAINAFKVERDMLDAFIVKLERMKAGQF